MKVCTKCGKYSCIKHYFKFCPYCGSQSLKIVNTETKAKRIMRDIDSPNNPISERR